RGNLVVARKQAKRQQRGHEDGERNDLKRNGRHLQREVAQHIHPSGVVAQETADLFKKIDDKIDRHETGETHEEDLGVFPEQVTEDDWHGRYCLLMRENHSSVMIRKTLFGSQAPAKGGITAAVTRNSQAIFIT